MLTILSSTEANIDVCTAEETISFTLPPGQVYKNEIYGDFDPIEGIQNQAIRIFSDVDVQVLIVKKEANDHYTDSYMVPNDVHESNTYFTSAHPGGISSYCSSNYSQQFYHVASFYDNTTIHVEQQNGAIYDLDLPAFGTFLQSTTDHEYHLAMGTMITSNKPINVVSGTRCVINNEQRWSRSGTYASSVPSLEFLGQEYIAPNIIYQYSYFAGYSITVVATEDDTIVESDEDAKILDQGETAIFEYPSIGRSIFVTCSKRCLVTQYSKVKDEGDSAHSGHFMQNLLSETDFSTSHYFTTLDQDPVSYLSLVLKGEAPGDDLYLNGASLDYLNWNPIHGYSTAELAIFPGVYELYSADGRPFAGYVYEHLPNGRYSAGGAAGYALLPIESSEVSPSPAPTTPSPTSTAPPPTTFSPTPTTPSPSENGTFPYHTARVNGTAITEDGEDMSPTCIIVSVNIYNVSHMFLLGRRDKFSPTFACLFESSHKMNSWLILHEHFPTNVSHVKKNLDQNYTYVIFECVPRMPESEEHLLQAI